MSKNKKVTFLDPPANPVTSSVIVPKPAVTPSFFNNFYEFSYDFMLLHL